MAKKNKVDTSSTFNPESEVEIPGTRVDEEVWSGLGETAMTLLDIHLGNRQCLDDSLDLWNAMYEMRIADKERDTPWENASNVAVPLIPTEVEEFVSRICGSAILPRPFSVRGNDPNSQNYAHTVEQFYNGEYARNKWEKEFRTAVHLAARDGTAVMEILWDLDETEREVVSEQQDESGQTTQAKSRIKITNYDAPRLKPVELRDFVLIPAYAPSIEEAEAVYRKRYMGEQELLRLVKAGIASKERVEEVLNYVSASQGELPIDRQGYSTYEINNLINVVDVTVSPPKGTKMNRGPLEVWVIYTNQYDLDGDGVPEDNVLWVHDRSRLLIGYCAFPYWQGKPFKSLTVFPRPNRFYGFSIPERLRGLQEEINAQHNARLDVMEWGLQPTILKDPAGVRLRTEDMSIGPGVILDAKPGSIEFLQPPVLPPANLQEEQMLIQYSQRLTGAPQSPGNPPAGSISTPQPGRQSARAAQSQAAIQGMSTNMVIVHVREFMLEVFTYIHNLYKQYGKNQVQSVDQTSSGTQRVIIPKETMCLDYTLGIAGMGGPMDKENRRQDMLMLAGYIEHLPFVQADMQKIWRMASYVAECFDIPEITSVLGTQEEAGQFQQAQAQAAQQQQQQQMVMQVLSHNKVGNAKGGAPQPQHPGMKHG